MRSLRVSHVIDGLYRRYVAGEAGVQTEHDAALIAQCRREVLAFSWPVLTELLLMSMISMASLALVGRLGKEAISIVGLSNQPVLIFMAVFQAFNVGATALVARAVGAEDGERARAIAVQTVIVSCAISVGIALVGVLGAEWIMLGMGAGPDILDAGSHYMRYMAVSFVFQGLPTSVAAILRGAGETEAPMRYNVISNIANIALGWVLIQGGLGISPLGLEGAAVASVCARAVAFVLAMRALVSPGLVLGLTGRERVVLDAGILRQVSRVGVSAAGEQLFARLGLLLYTRIVAELGTTAVAAHQINLTVSSLAFNGVTALSAAASSFVGRSLGRRAPDEGERYWKEALTQGYVFSLGMGGAYFFFGTHISSLFTQEVEVIALSALVLKVNAIISAPQSVFTVMAGGLRGAGDTRYPMVAALIGSCLLRVSLATFFVFGLKLGLLGAWYAALLDQCVRAMLIYRRVALGKWKTLKL